VRRTEAKAQSRQHRIDFRDAQAIFEGPLVTAEDSREDHGETRYVALDLLDGIVISVACTERSESIRIISIRKALEHEARFFLSQIGK
jgi:uncharacterized protein